MKPKWYKEQFSQLSLGAIDYICSETLKMSFSKDFECDTFSLIFYIAIFIERVLEPLSVITTLILIWKLHFTLGAMDLFKGSWREVDTTKKIFFKLSHLSHIRWNLYLICVSNFRFHWVGFSMVCM